VTHVVDAIYEQGTLKLAHLLELPENTAATVTVESAHAPENLPKCWVEIAPDGLPVIKSNGGPVIASALDREIEANT
jgi:predicted DNA-binding antitoxin AbrB/MazE fold protein